MRAEKKRALPPFVTLCLVSIVMSFAIAGVYMLTKDTIAAAALEAQAAARSAVMEDAAVMTEIVLPEEEPLDWLYEAYDGTGELLGYVGQITVIGFGGEIEVTVGVDTAGSITAISVGGSDFSETSGLGAKTREPAFTEQFRGRSGMLVLKQDIDSVTGASISSGAVVSGVNKALAYMTALLPEDVSAASDSDPLPLSAEQLQAVLPGAAEAVWMGSVRGIDGWWQAENGYVVRATGFGEGPIAVTVGFTADGVVTGLVIGDENFMETEGRGDRVLEDWYAGQFIGRSGVQAYGDGLDAVSGATVTSNATLAAINAAMAFDPADPAASAAAAEEAPASAEPDPNVPVPDAVTEASIPEEETQAQRMSPALSGMPVPVSEPDAVTEASVTE